MKNMFSMRLRVAVGVVAISAALTGCATAVPESTTSVEVHGSRAVLYESIDSVVADSAVVVTAKVTSQSQPKDGIAGSPGTISALAVIEAGTSDLVKPGGEVFVFQYGSETVSAMAPLLKVGETYLLFLSSTALPDARSNDFFVTGNSAGIYQLTSDGYKRLGTDPDKLPELITQSEVAALLAVK